MAEKEWQTALRTYLPTKCWDSAIMYGTAVRIECGEKVVQKGVRGEYEVGSLCAIIYADQWSVFSSDNKIYESLLGSRESYDKLKRLIIGQELTDVKTHYGDWFIIFYFSNSIEIRVRYSRMLDEEIEMAAIFLPNRSIIYARDNHDFITSNEQW